MEIYEEHDERAKQVRKPCSELSAATTQNMALALPPAGTPFMPETQRDLAPSAVDQGGVLG